MKKELIKEFVSHDLCFGLVSENYDYVRIYLVGSWYEVEYKYTSMNCPTIFKHSEFRLAMYDFNRLVNFLISR